MSGGAISFRSSYMVCTRLQQLYPDVPSSLISVMRLIISGGTPSLRVSNATTLGSRSWLCAAMWLEILAHAFQRGGGSALGGGGGGTVSTTSAERGITKVMDHGQQSSLVVGRWLCLFRCVLVLRKLSAAAAFVTLTRDLEHASTSAYFCLLALSCVRCNTRVVMRDMKRLAYTWLVE